MLEEFTFDGYRWLVDRMRRERRNLRFEDLGEQLPVEPFFLLRHDIDYSPAKALEMAVLEADWGVRATYFFLLSCPDYNLLSEQYGEVPRRIEALGHEVGLHYDLRALRQFCDDPLVALHEQLLLMGRLLRRPVRSIAMHNPSTSGPDPFRRVPGIVNAYDERYARQIAYYSDSCGLWRPEALAAFREGPLATQLQVLVHPIFWGPDRRDRFQRLDAFLENEVERIRRGGEGARYSWHRHAVALAAERLNVGASS